MSEHKNGAVVKFKGGTGRGWHGPQIETGIVNGPTQFSDGGAFVPVFVRSQNRIVLVASTNIIEVVTP